eukprot:SAG25_NODE_2769_length_1393_cov_2.800618_1_plen_141_part_00
MVAPVPAPSMPAIARPNSSRSMDIVYRYAVFVLAHAKQPNSTCRVPGLTTRLSCTWAVVTTRVSTYRAAFELKHDFASRFPGRARDNVAREDLRAEWPSESRGSTPRTDGTMAPSSAPSASVAELQRTLHRTPCSSLFHV